MSRPEVQNDLAQSRTALRRLKQILLIRNVDDTSLKPSYARGHRYDGEPVFLSKPRAHAHCRQCAAGEPATLSLHSVDETWTPHDEQPLIYFEVEDLEAFINKCNLTPISPPEMQSYKWHEADILDPAGNRIRLYTAGQNRRFPPWRIS